MNKEANLKNKKVGTLLTMLHLLDRYGVTDSMLHRKYGLNRTSLNNVRKGRELPNAHGPYFKVLLKELEGRRQLCRQKMDEQNHRLIMDTMFDVMLQEFGVFHVD